MAHEPDVHGLESPAYVLYAEGLVDLLAHGLVDPANQGENFDARTIPVADLVAAGLRGDEIIGASSEDIENARAIALERWATFWGYDPNDLTPNLPNLRQRVRRED